jgi:hypothetical protein
LTHAIRDRERLKRILDLSDRLGVLRRRLGDDGEMLSLRDLRNEIRSIAGSLVSIGVPGSLGELEKTHHLGPHPILVLLLLLNRRLDPGDGTLSGREILSTVFPSAYGVLSGVTVLAADSPLRTSGAVDLVLEGDSILGSRFRLSDALFDAVVSEVVPRLPAASPTDVRPYRNHFEHLADLARLTSLLLRRANASFDADPYGNRIFDERESAEHLHRISIRFADRIRARLELTERAAEFPAVQLVSRLGLSADEVLLLVVLLVQECYYGSPGLEAVECLKMLSRNPEDLLEKRCLLRPDGALRRHGLIELEDAIDDKELTADLTLPRWVSLLLLGLAGETGREPIGPDTRIEFHEYLKDLEDSERFYRDLEN